MRKSLFLNVFFHNFVFYLKKNQAVYSNVCATGNSHAVSFHIHQGR